MSSTGWTDMFKLVNAMQLVELEAKYGPGMSEEKRREMETYKWVSEQMTKIAKELDEAEAEFHSRQ